MEVPQLLLAFFHGTHLHKEPVNVFLWFCWKGKRNNLDLLHVWTWTTFPCVFWMPPVHDNRPHLDLVGYFVTIGNMPHWRIQGGAKGTRPHSRFIFFHLMQLLGTNGQCNRLVPPPLGFAPPYGKFRIHYCMGLARVEDWAILQRKLDQPLLLILQFIYSTMCQQRLKYPKYLLCFGGVYFVCVWLIPWAMFMSYC